MKNPTAELRQRIKATSLRKTALAIGISAAYLSDIMNGKRNPGPKVLKALGYKRTVKRRISYEVTR